MVSFQILNQFFLREDQIHHAGIIHQTKLAIGVCEKVLKGLVYSQI